MNNEVIEEFQKTVRYLNNYSEGAMVFVLIHKIDMVPNKEEAFEQAKQTINKLPESKHVVACFATTIWDVSLYNAWSNIVQTIMPDLQSINRSLEKFCKIIECDEIILFEKSTFLIVAFYKKDNNNKQEEDPKNILKYERISTIVKQFKLSCNRVGSEISMMSIQNSTFKAVIDEFTKNTFILMVSMNPNIKCPALHFNIECAKNFFRSDKASEEINNLLHFGG